MKVLHVVPSLDVATGGTAYAVAKLCEHLSDRGVTSRILTIDDNHLFRGTTEAGICVSKNVVIKSLAGFGSVRLRFFWSPAFSIALRNEVLRFEPNIIHSHGMWRLENHSAVKIAKRFSIPIVISPHGTLSSWALGRKALKKKLAWHLYQKRDFESATLVHATATHELEDTRKAGFRKTMALIPNGVEIPEYEYKKAPKSRSAERIALFLSRINPEKGVERLIDAWKQIDTAGWRCHIVGPGEPEYVKRLKEYVSTCGLHNEILFFNGVQGPMKWERFANADIFVLPTNTENFGLVVAEALAAGTPVVTTKGAPWKDLEKHGCGWWVDVDTAAVACAMKNAMDLSDDERQMMGRRGRDLVARKYTWPKSAADMSAVYSWILGKGPVPECVQQ